MTTVEELRESLCSFVLSHIRWGGIEAIMAPDPKVPVAYAVDSLIAAAREEGEKEGQKNAVLRIREHSTYRSNLPEAGYYEVDAELLDEFDDDEQPSSVLSPAPTEPEATP